MQEPAYYEEAQEDQSTGRQGVQERDNHTDPEASFAQNAPFIALFNDHEQIINRHQMSLSAVE